MSCILHDWIALQNQTNLIYDFVCPLYKFWLCNLFEIESEYLHEKITNHSDFDQAIILVLRFAHPYGV